MDGLPLALDQAGAYIEEIKCSLSDYLDFYQTRRSELLNWRDELAKDYPKSVATTWSLSFEKVQKANAASAELLQLLAFLYPDAIPEEIISEGAPDLGEVLGPVAADAFQLNEAIRELLRYSLVRRDPNKKLLSIHRLVQEVIKDRMNTQVQRQWAERAVRAVNRAFPYVEFENWQECQRCLPQAQTCAALIEQWGMVFPEAARLLNQTGVYLYERGQYTEAEPLYQQALAIDEKVQGSEHPDVATYLNNLAALYYEQGKHEQAEPLYQQALAIIEKMLGPEHPNLARHLENYAYLLLQMGREDEAKKMENRADEIWARRARGNTVAGG